MDESMNEWMNKPVFLLWKNIRDIHTANQTRSRIVRRKLKTKIKKLLEVIFKIDIFLNSSREPKNGNIFLQGESPSGYIF